MLRGDCGSMTARYGSSAYILAVSLRNVRGLLPVTGATSPSTATYPMAFLFLWGQTGDKVGHAKPIRITCASAWLRSEIAEIEGRALRSQCEWNATTNGPR